MAYADYRLCDVCGGKTFYDANLDYHQPDAEHPAEWRLPGVGSMKVICKKCAETHEVVVRPRGAASELYDALYAMMYGFGDDDVRKRAFAALAKAEQATRRSGE